VAFIKLNSVHRPSQKRPFEIALVLDVTRSMEQKKRCGLKDASKELILAITEKQERKHFPCALQLGRQTATLTSRG